MAVKPHFFLQPAPSITYPTTGATCLIWLLESIGRPHPAELPADDKREDLQDALHAAGLTSVNRFLPLDAVAQHLRSNLPAFVRLQLPGNEVYWALVTQHLGNSYQIADPILGVRWLSAKRLQAILYSESRTLPAADWDTSPILERLQALQVLDAPLDDVVALDAASRMLAQMVGRGQVQRGDEAQQLLHSLLQAPTTRIPAHFWKLRAEGAQLHVTGVDVLDVTGLPVAETVETEDTPPRKYPRWLVLLPPVLRPYVRLENRAFLVLVGLASVLAAGAVFVQAVLLRALLDLGFVLAQPAQRIQVIVLLLAFGVTLLLLKWGMQRATLRIGHRLDARLRLALLALLPDLSARYTRRMALGDLFERLHSLRALRQMPHYLAEFLQLTMLLVFTLVGLFWIDPLVGLLAILRLVSVGVANLVNQIGSAAHYEARYHLGRLSRLYLDVFQGMVPLRAHRAQAALLREYRQRVRDWSGAVWRQLSLEIWLAMAANLLSHLLIVVLLVVYVVRVPDLSNWLLLLYWTLSLDAIGYQLLETLFYLRRDQIKVERFSQVLGAPTESAALPTDERPTTPEPAAAGVALQLQAVTVQSGAHTLLQDVDLTLNPGEHVVVLGASGAGKSTLMALLLGLQVPSAGDFWMDGALYTRSRLQALRQQTAWVSADVVLWQQTLLANLQYGGQQLGIPTVIEAADLAHLLERLPQGLQTDIGEDGRRLSGGEGQRVRFGRALQRQDARLVILDEPFRELEPARRRRLLAQARAYWSQATLLYITHAPHLAQDFDRLLVLQDGRIVQDGTPAILEQQADAPYAQMLAAHNQDLWATWQRWQMNEGKLITNDISEDKNG